MYNGTADGVIELYPRIGSVTTLSSASIMSFIGRAENEINAALSVRYTIPVSGSPPLLKDLSEELAAVRILRRFFSQEKENLSEWIDGWNTEIHDRLRALATGSASLVTSAGVRLDGDGQTLAPWSSTSQYKPTADVRDATRQHVDIDRLRDEEQKDTGLEFLDGGY